MICIDVTKTQIQALDRTAPILPIRPGVPDKQAQDYRRDGTTSLFAALAVATGKVTDARHERHTNVEFLAFLRHAAKAHLRRKLHVAADNFASYKHPDVQKWLAKNTRVTMHLTPTSASWMSMVEIFFEIVTRQAIGGGAFHSVGDFKEAPRAFLDGWNDRCEPFIWTQDTDMILAKAKRQ